MKLEYALSDKAQQQLLQAGDPYYNKSYREIEFEPGDLTPEARKAWIELFGTATHAELRPRRITDGTIWDDGSVSEYKPYIDKSTTWFEQDQILTPETISESILQLHQQFQEVKAELEEHLPKWQKARAEYEKKLVKQKAEADRLQAENEAREQARKQRLAKLGWIQQLTQKLAVEGEKEAEIKRFCEKFEVLEEDLTIDDISDEPYTRLSVSIQISVGEIDRTLEISNRTYHDIGENEGLWESAEFSDLATHIAEALAEIFSGKVETVTDYRRGIAYLNVSTLNVSTQLDTINIATDELERAEW